MQWWYNNPRARRRDNRGAAAVEFALVLLPLITILLGTIQFGYYFFAAQSTSSAAREVTRRLIVGDCQDAGQRDAFANGQANVAGGLTITTDYTALPDVGQTIKVTVTADGGIISFLPMPNSGIVERVVKSRVEDQAEGAPCT